VATAAAARKSSQACTNDSNKNAQSFLTLGVFLSPTVDDYISLLSIPRLMPRAQYSTSHFQAQQVPHFGRYATHTAYHRLVA